MSYRRTVNVQDDRVFSLINRNTGEVRSRIIPNSTGPTLGKAMTGAVNIARSDLHTDSWTGYQPIGRQFLAHQTVNHEAGELVWATPPQTTPSVNSGKLKRSIDGTYHRVSVQHLSPLPLGV